MFLGMLISSIFVINQYSIYDLQDLTWIYSLFFLAFVCLGIHPGFHRQIYRMVILLSIIPCVTVWFLLKSHSSWDEDAIRLMIAIQIASFIVIYPIAISMGAFINGLEEANNISKPIIDHTRKYSFYIILSFIFILFFLEAFFISALGIDGGEVFIPLIVYSFIFLICYLYNPIIKLMLLFLGGIRKENSSKRVLEHSLFFFVYSLFFFVLWFGSIILKGENYQDFNQLYYVGSPIFLQLLGFITIRYLAGIMKSYNPTMFIFATTFLLYVPIVIYIFILLPAETLPF